MFSLFILVLLVGQVALEGQRWQMWPAYLVIVWLSAYLMRPCPPVPGRWMVVVNLVLLIAAGTIATLLPVFKLPKPTGPFPIGTVIRPLSDTSRAEGQDGSQRNQREVTIQIWYPAAHLGPPRPYRLRSEAGLRRDRLALVKTHSALGPPVSSASLRYPVVFFTPKGSRDEATCQTEELASHGYFVVGIDPPQADDSASFLDYSSEEALDASILEVNARLRRRVADVSFVLDEMERLTRNDPDGLLTDRLDLTRVGVFGYSFGGAVATEACRADPRFRAGADLDGLLFGDSAVAGVVQPFLFLSDDISPPTTAEPERPTPTRALALSVQETCSKSIRDSIAAHGGYLVVVRGTRHPNFADDALSSPMKGRMGLGSIDPSRATCLIRNCLLVFFEQYLNDRQEVSFKEFVITCPELRLKEWASPKRS